MSAPEPRQRLQDRPGVLLAIIVAELIAIAIVETLSFVPR